MSQRQQSNSHQDSPPSPFAADPQFVEQPSSPIKIIEDKEQQKVQKPLRTSQKMKLPEPKPISRINLLPLSLPKNLPQKRCFNCRVGQSSTSKNSSIILIQLEDEEYYCDACLLETYQEEQSKMCKIQEKYIYQKEFQTSGMAQELNSFSKLNQVEDEEYNMLQRQVIALERQEKDLIDSLIQTKKQCSQLQQIVYSLQRKEDKFWQDINKLEKRALKLEEKDFTAKSQRDYESATLDRMSRGNILHQFFKIEIEDNYGQIYGLTIGKRPDMVDVNWEHTNAGLAHLLLAYNYLSLKYGIPYIRIQQIKIKGTLSEIILRNSQASYSICYTGKDNQKYFGLVMDTLLLELQDLAQTIQEIENIEYSEEFKLPFYIDKKQVKILDLSVNPTRIEQKSKWNVWTKSMRYFLIDFKHLLTISSLHDPYL